MVLHEMKNNGSEKVNKLHSSNFFVIIRADFYLNVQIILHDDL